jgi:hypothetical protein
MYRGTTIEDAGYKRGAGWPFVADINEALERTKLIRIVALAAVPAMGIAYAAMLFSGSTPVLSLIAPAAVALLAVAFILHQRKVRNGLVRNCKMIKVIAEGAGTDIEHTVKVVWETITAKGGHERIASLNDQFGVYVNDGYKTEDGRKFTPFIIPIRKVEEASTEQAA